MSCQKWWSKTTFKTVQTRKISTVSWQVIPHSCCSIGIKVMSDTRSGTRKKQFVLIAAVPVVTAQSEKVGHVKVYQTKSVYKWITNRNVVFEVPDFLIEVWPVADSNCRKLGRRFVNFRWTFSDFDVFLKHWIPDNGTVLQARANNVVKALTRLLIYR